MDLEVFSFMFNEQGGIRQITRRRNKFYWATQKQIPKLSFPFPTNRITRSVDMNLVSKCSYSAKATKYFVCRSHFSYKAVWECYCNIISPPSEKKCNTITYFLSCERLLLYYEEKRSELRRKTNKREADDSNEKEMILYRSHPFYLLFPFSLYSITFF
jgi:hypothetical protein